MSLEFETFKVTGFKRKLISERKSLHTYGIDFDFKNKTVTPWFLEDEDKWIEQFLKGAALGVLTNESGENDSYFSENGNKSDEELLYLEYFYGLDFGFQKKKKVSLEDTFPIEKYLVGNDISFDPIIFTGAVQDYFKLPNLLYFENEALFSRKRDEQLVDLANEIKELNNL